MANLKNKIISDFINSSDLMDLIVVSVKYNYWIPEFDNATIYNSSVPEILSIIKSIKNMEVPYNRISYPDYELGLSRKVIGAGGSLCKHYARARQITEDPGYFRETRIYLSKDNKPVFTSKIMDEFDKFIHDYFNKDAE